jgi:G3E family GTPase
VLTKLDLAGEAAALRDRLRELNAAAPLLEAGEQGVDPQRLFGVSPFRPGAATLEQWLGMSAGGGHSAEIVAHCFTLGRPVGGAAFSEFLARLTDACGEDLLRVKGILDVAERPGAPAVIHGVQHIFHPVMWLPAWPGPDHRSRIVFITRGVPRAEIEALLAPLAGAP